MIWGALQRNFNAETWFYLSSETCYLHTQLYMHVNVNNKFLIVYVLGIIQNLLENFFRI